MSHLRYLDELVREYLLFRGFTITLKSFDGELKVDKDRGFRVDRIVDQFVIFINNYDLASLRELWLHFDQKIFSKLEHDFTPGLRKLESSLLKFYLVNAVANNKLDKVNEFFVKMTPDLQGLPEWKEWFMLPYIKNPEDHSTFAVHFTKQWQDTFLVSLHNFLAIIYQVMPQAALSSYEEEATKLRRLQEENEALKHKLATLTQCANVVPDAVPPIDIMDDFYIIAQETPTSGEGHSKSLKSLIRTIGGGLPTSPVMGRKPHSQDEIGVQKQHSSKRHGSQGGWIKSGSTETVPKRSLSLDSRTRRARDVSLESAERRSGGKDHFLLLSQERMNEHKAKVVQCKFNALGNLVASCDSDGVLKIWCPDPTIKIQSTSRFPSAFTALSWLFKNEKYFVTGSIDGVLRLHHEGRDKAIWEVTGDDSPFGNSEILSVSCSPTGCYVTCTIDSTEKDANVLIYDVKSKKIENSLKLGKGLKATCSQFNHNGSLVIAGCSDGSVRTLDLRNGDCVCSWEAHQGAVSAIQLTPDHNICYSFGQDHKLCKHNLVQSGEPSKSVQLPNCDSVQPHGTQSFSLHQNGNHVLTACGNQGATIYHVSESGVQPMLQLGDHRSSLTTCDWSTANQCATCLSSSADGKIKISMILTP